MDFLTILLSLLISLLTSIAGGVVANRITKSSSASKAGRKWYSLVIALLVFLLVSLSFLPVVLLSLLPLGAQIPTFIIVVGIITPVLQVLMALGIYVIFRKRRPLEIHKRQYGDPFWLEFRKGAREYRMEARRLFEGDLRPDSRIDLNWSTFGDGIGYLLQQIQVYSPSMDPDLCIGINHAGMMIASFISGSFVGGKKILGFIKTKRDKHDIVETVISQAPRNVGSILVVDSEVKSGNSLRNVISFLREKYGSQVDIKIAVLAACGVRDKVTDINDLMATKKGSFTEDVSFLPHFLAFISQRKIETPGKIG